MLANLSAPTWITDLWAMLSAFPMVKVLGILILADIVSGTLAAIGKKTLNSTTSFIGVTRKAMVILILALSAAMEPFAGGIPLANMVALLYIKNELISIAENAAALGVQFPDAIMEMLSKVQTQKAAKLEQKTPTQKLVPILIAGLSALCLSGCAYNSPGTTQTTTIKANVSFTPPLTDLPK